MLKIILDTDIGTDVDDAWALSLALASPELEIAGVTLVHGDLDVRAKIAGKLLRFAGQESNVPLIKGTSHPITENYGVYWNGRENQWALDSEAIPVATSTDAVEFIVNTVANDPDVVICAIGPLTNIALAIREAPDIMKNLKRLYIMGASFTGFGVPIREHNVRLDPLATKIVYELSGIPITSIGLNVTKQVTVSRQQLGDYRNCGDYMRFLGEMTVDYMDTNYGDYTYMHDPLTIATILDPGVVTCIPGVSAIVLDNGYVNFQNKPGNIDIAVNVQADVFGSLLSRVFTTFGN